MAWREQETRGAENILIKWDETEPGGPYKNTPLSDEFESWACRQLAGEWDKSSATRLSMDRPPGELSKICHRFFLLLCLPP